MSSTHAAPAAAGDRRPAAPAPAGRWARFARRPGAVVAALAALVAVFLALTLWWHRWFDLTVYRGAMVYWLRDGGQLYDFLTPGTKYGFTYPPFAAYVMAPMAFLPWPLVIVVSVAASAAAAYALLRWLLLPLADRRGWPRWYVLALAGLLTVSLEPVRETFTFGQVNLLLLVVVAADVLLLVGRDSRWAGVGIGLATAVKLTPGVFLIYLLVTRRWRAAGVATAAAGLATLLPGVLTPDTARGFWTDAIWDTDRIGTLTYASNQNLQGLVARLHPEHPSGVLWGVLVLAALGYWLWRVTRPECDAAAGLALTAVLGCLISPVTWVHHLVWLLPALVLCAGYALDLPPGRRRTRWLVGVGLIAALLSSRIVWAWERDFSGVDGFVGGNMYVWLSIALLVMVPSRTVWRPLGAAADPAAPAPADRAGPASPGSPAAPGAAAGAAGPVPSGGVS
ncbi:membrane protein [Pilimelia anulata]|uniref:Membrane protein n=1 Tax=Pilimelia anulata TaxID=53371 RepID=A0A8J3AZL2_9ACTN|nr:glycosyltransferase 87 family protein [Pilimelia anulata]GGJ77202.1 membrane protein [Pilimelia anulata]